jgi:hypothetical protein
MSQRESGYERVAFDQYETPAWATRALVPHIPERVRNIWEPACGSGKMVAELSRTHSVGGTDIQSGEDFFSTQGYGGDAIITNPPYSIAQEFIEHALELTMAQSGFVAMLLRCDFDHAKTRRHLFSNHAAFAKKLVLTKRIRWIEDSKGSPSFNHAWYLFDWQHRGSPSLAYHFEER